MDIQELVSYTHELQVENRELKKHIFNIQQQLNQKNQSILLINQKRDQLTDHIKKCQNQIIKREQRQLSLLQSIESLTKQLSIYAQQFQKLKHPSFPAPVFPTPPYQQKQKQPSPDSLQQKNSKIPKMPPKSSQKCKNCQLLALDKDGLFIQLQKQREKCYFLIRDIECMVGNFCQNGGENGKNE